MDSKLLLIPALAAGIGLGAGLIALFPTKVEEVMMAGLVGSVVTFGIALLHNARMRDLE